MSNRKSLIYIVDDDISVCKAIALLLKLHDFTVETFTCAEDFLAFKHLKVPSCLVLDITLPGINGFALQDTMAVRKLNIPIVFITGYGDVAKSVRAIKAGAIDFILKSIIQNKFILKPVTKGKLLRAISVAIGKSKIQNKIEAKAINIRRRIETLSPKELEVFRFVARGMLSKQIASKRGTSLQTIKVQRSHVMHKMHAKTVTELINLALQAGIIPSQK